MAEDNVQELVAQAKAGDSHALSQLFNQYKKQLRTMIALRLSGKLKERIDPSDVLQDAWLDVVRKLEKYDADDMSFFVWLRLVTSDQLMACHRKHLGTQKRDPRRELRRQHLPASALSLNNFFVDKHTSISGKAIKAERIARLHATLEGMEDEEREVIAMRVFEGLSNSEVAEVLQITTNAASKRFIKAIGKIKSELKALQSMVDV